MKPVVRLKRWLVIQSILVVILCVALKCLEGMAWVLPAVLAVQGAMAAICVFVVIVPLENFERALSSLLSEEYRKEPETFPVGTPYMGEIEPLIDLYSSRKTRKNTAQIFDKQSELTALQSQINPHFLYNTLDSIRGQALLDDNAEIARMVEALSSFFRYSISRKGNLVTLRDELANINNYMLIQRYRFNNRFSLEVVIDEEDEAAYDYLIPKLIIQPVVENAVFHGLEEKMEGGRVTIEVIVTESSLIITISDNGSGIESNALQALNRRIHSQDMKLEDEGENQQRNTGIALPNIHKRIQLLFGEEYGVNVYSTVGQGTDVEITVPANYQREAGEV